MIVMDTDRFWCELCESVQDANDLHNCIEDVCPFCGDHGSPQGDGFYCPDCREWYDRRTK